MYHKSSKLHSPLKVFCLSDGCSRRGVLWDSQAGGLYITLPGTITATPYTNRPTTSKVFSIPPPSTAHTALNLPRTNLWLPCGAMKMRSCASRSLKPGISIFQTSQAVLRSGLSTCCKSALRCLCNKGKKWGHCM